MLTMVLDTSTNLLLVSFIKDESVIYEVKEKGKNNHSDHLINNIKKGLDEFSLEVKDFNRIIVGIGPGAYTGLRVSLTVAKMFSWSLNIPLYTISSLDLLTTGVREDGIYGVNFKAKRDYCYSKLFKVENNEKYNLTEDKFLSVEDFINLVKVYDNIKLIDNDLINVDVLRIKNENLKLVKDIHSLEPNYLRSVM